MKSVSESVLTELERRKPNALTSDLTTTRMRERMTPLKPSLPKEPPATYREAVTRLRDKSWLQSQQHKDKVKFTDLSTASEDLAVFVRKLIRRLAKMQVPLECVSASYDVAFIQHSRRGADLAPKEWEIIVHLGEEICTQCGLKVRWGGPSMPRVWMGNAKPAKDGF